MNCFKFELLFLLFIICITNCKDICIEILVNRKNNICISIHFTMMIPSPSWNHLEQTCWRIWISHVHFFFSLLPHIPRELFIYYQKCNDFHFPSRFWSPVKVDRWGYATDKANCFVLGIQASQSLNISVRKNL